MKSPISIGSGMGGHASGTFEESRKKTGEVIWLVSEFPDTVLGCGVGRMDQ
jgi:hypothetical protein